MRIFTLSLCLLVALSSAKKHHHSSEEEVEDKQSAGEKMVDRLAVNLAGAFVKSMFPEMERGSTAPPPTSPPEVRRAPANYGGLNANMGNYNAENVMSTYNAIPQMNQQAPSNPFGYQSQLPYQQPSLQEAQTAVGVPNIPSLLTAGSGSPESVNAVRNQQYLSQLAKHQADVNAYSAKQLEYLDNQRRYQQAMIDHQAGAALLMQKQQQEAINRQMEKMKSSYGTVDHQTDDNTVGGKVLSRARGVKTHQPEAPAIDLLDDDVNTNDAHLRKFFKQEYGIDVGENGDNLTEDEKETLRQLKQELMKNKESAIEKGTFKTMERLKGKLEKGKNDQRKSPRKSSSERLASAPQDGEACNQCIPIDMKMLRGAWTQMYGNPAALKKKFGTIMSLSQASLTKGKASMSSKKISCIGAEFGRVSNNQATLNFFYRENGNRNRLREMKGTVSNEDNILNFETDSYATKMCLVKYGPSETDRYEYIVLAETEGKNACRSYHVFARNTDEFNRRHFDDISEFMEKEAIPNDVLPVGAIPKASLCQLDRP